MPDPVPPPDGTVRVVRLDLLGGFRLTAADGGTVELDSARGESLLAYLALNPDPRHGRRQLAALLWPQSAEGQARTNLRHLLHTLSRTAAVRVLLEVTPSAVGWRQEAGCAVEVADFEAALSRAEATDGAARPLALSQAIARYVGELLPACDDEWLRQERARLRARYIDALDALAECLHARGDHCAAVVHLEWLLREEPLRESAYRRLMEVHAAQGDRARAVQTYHACVSVLEGELGISPSAQTRAGFAALLPGPADGAARRAARSDEAPLVGRVAERRQLGKAWRDATAGRSRLVVLSGEAGIGKTRLAEGFARWCGRQGAVTAVARGHPAERVLPYAPVITWLRNPAVRSRTARLGMPWRIELTRLLPELPSDGTEPGVEALSAGERRLRLFDAVAHALLDAGRPVLLVADDLQWFDRDSLGLLHYLLRSAADAPLLVLVTARVEELSPPGDVRTALRSLGDALEIPLRPLSEAEAGELVTATGGQRLDQVQRARLYGESEGNPLFLVEAVRAGWPENREPSPRVEAVIHARLEGLSAGARDLAGLAATVGREFATDVLAAASGLGDEDLVAALDELWLRRILREQGVIAYDFAHDLIREIAYRTLTPARRRRHHRAVAATLARAGAGTPDELCGRIAGHYQRAGAFTEAVPWTLRAASTASRLHADADAVALLDHALDLVRSMPASRARSAAELDLLTALPAPLCAVEGYSTADLTSAQTRAVQLAAVLDSELEPPMIRSLALSSLTGSDFAAAEGYAGQLLARGERDGDDILIIEAAYVQGVAAFWQARHEAAERHFRLAIERYRPEHRAVHLLRYGQDPLVICTSRLANALWFLGRPSEAAATRDSALIAAEATAHPYSRQVALLFAALLALDASDLARLREHATLLHALRPEAKQVRVSLEALTGCLEVFDGQVERGMQRCRSAIADQERVASAPGTWALLQRVLLAAAEHAGDADTAVAAADRLLGRGDGARVWHPEARRARKRLLGSGG